MNDKIEILKKQQAALQKKTLIILVLIIASFIITLFSYTIGIAGFIVAMLIYVFVLRKGKKAYKYEMKKAILEEGMRKFLKEPQYISKDGISAQEIEEADFIPVDNKESIYIKDVLKGSYKNKPVILAEVTSNFHAQKNGKDIIDYISGVYFDIELGGNFQEMKLLFDEKRLPEGQEIYGELYASYLRLVKYTPGKVALQVKDGHLHVFVANRFLYTIEVPVRTEVNDKLIRYCDFSEISYLLRMADTLL